MKFLIIFALTSMWIFAQYVPPTPQGDLRGPEKEFRQWSFGLEIEVLEDNRFGSRPRVILLEGIINENHNGLYFSSEVLNNTSGQVIANDFNLPLDEVPQGSGNYQYGVGFFGLIIKFDKDLIKSINYFGFPVDIISQSLEKYKYPYNKVFSTIRFNQVSVHYQGNGIPDELGLDVALIDSDHENKVKQTHYISQRNFMEYVLPQLGDLFTNAPIEYFWGGDEKRKLIRLGNSYHRIEKKLVRSPNNYGCGFQAPQKN